MITNEDINECIYGEYIEGDVLKDILENIIDEPMIQSIILRQFDIIYNYKESETLLLQQYDMNLDLSSMKLLLHECQILFIILICIKASYDEYLSEKERLQKEKEQQEMEEKAKQKGKKSKKDKKSKKQEEEQNVEEEIKEEKIEELKWIKFSPDHFDEMLEKFRVQLNSK